MGLWSWAPRAWRASLSPSLLLSVVVVPGRARVVPLLLPPLPGLPGGGVVPLASCSCCCEFAARASGLVPPPVAATFLACRVFRPRTHATAQCSSCLFAFSELPVFAVLYSTRFSSSSLKLTRFRLGCKPHFERTAIPDCTVNYTFERCALQHAVFVRSPDASVHALAARCWHGSATSCSQTRSCDLPA